jgi:hypothetical protein
MEWTADQLKMLARGAEAGNQGEAPRVVLEAAGSLLGPDTEPLAVACAATVDEGVVTWRLVYLTESTLIYVEASRQGAYWSRGYDKPLETLDAWAKPLRSVAGVEVDSTRSTDDPHFRTNSWNWETTYVIDIAGQRITLPLPGYQQSGAADVADRLVRELLRRL